MTTARTVELLVTQLIEAMKGRGYTDKLEAWVSHSQWSSGTWHARAEASGAESYEFAQTAEEAVDKLTDKIAAWPPRFTDADVARTLGLTVAA